MSSFSLSASQQSSSKNGIFFLPHLQMYSILIILTLNDHFSQEFGFYDDREQRRAPPPLDAPGDL
jgi:hypothetical protein